MRIHQSLRDDRGRRGGSAFGPPEACVRFTVETRHAIDPTMRGGDLFDMHLRADGSAAILIADVSSKGTRSIVHTETMRRAFRMCAMTERRPAAIMSELNRLRFGGPPPFTDGTFASAIIVAVERGTMNCRYASAGHDIGLFARGRSHRHAMPTGPVLGVLADAAYADCTEPFGPRDLLILATDGFTECRDDTEEARQFGTAGIARAVAAEALHSCTATSRAVVLRADAFTGGRYRDDATLAVIARNDCQGQST